MFYFIILGFHATNNTVVRYRTKRLRRSNKLYVFFFAYSTYRSGIAFNLLKAHRKIIIFSKPPVMPVRIEKAMPCSA